MAEHSTFKVGGPADCWLKPSGDGFPMFTVALLQAARVENVPVFILGGGANILVADAGIRGIVLDTGGWAGLAGQGDGTLEFRSGTSLDTAADIAAGLGLSGLEFLAGMPGSIGGAVWMNARCYGVEIADVLKETEVVDFSGSEPQHRRIMAKKEEFAYKHSPFQNQRSLILSAAFFVKQAEAHEIRVEMNAHRKDREDKGHYRYPSAGSIFKNNPGFGKPAGKIIDELGLRGLQKGGAQVAPWHGNIIVNLGSATAQDIRDLVDEVSVKVTAATGFVFEPEVLFAGEWLY
ncbi:MAG: UDP-N-acetylmuramate dehydrogenase [Treponema sp.]|nr:UDP-N-acetylmuramate dehydrogenase [Treponema sp.]